MTGKSEHTKSLLLQAANRLITQVGIQNLTLEAVAAAAGVSKGGLLYHFPSKDALILAMIDYYLQQFETRLQSHLAGDRNNPKAWVRAYVLATLDPAPDEFDVSASMMAAIAINPRLLEAMRERYRVWQSTFDQALPPSIGRIVRLALDGWWISNLLQLAPPDPLERELLQTSLLRLIEEKR